MSVSGYDPVLELPNQPLGKVIIEASGRDPRAEEIEVVPAQVGVSGIIKADGENDHYGNVMGGKVLFQDLIPVSWHFQTKRLGYKQAVAWARSDLHGNFDQKELHFNLELEPTKLMVLMDSPYDDPELMAGLEVTLSGFEGANTEGILRTVKSAVNPGLERAVALFENILPGEYLVTVRGSGEKKVNITVDGKPLYDDPYYEPTKFSVNFNGSDVFYANCGRTTQVSLTLQPEKTLFRGVLYARDKELSYLRGDNEGWGYLAAGKEVEIIPSAYYSQQMPVDAALQKVTTNKRGEFEVELYPGLYGFKIKGMNDYWGSTVEFDDGRYVGWPYYQKWPYSYKSAKAYTADYLTRATIGGVGLSSGENTWANFFMHKKECYVMAGWNYINNPLKYLVCDLDYEQLGDPDAFLKTIEYDDIKNNGAITLSGPVSKTINLKETEDNFAYFTELPPGHYSVSLSHRYFKVDNNVSFQIFNFPAPGELPATAFPEKYNEGYGNPWPLIPQQVQPMDCSIPSTDDKTLEKMYDIELTEVYTEDGELKEAFVIVYRPYMFRPEGAEYQNLLFEYDRGYLLYHSLVPNIPHENWIYVSAENNRVIWYKLPTKADGSIKLHANIASLKSVQPPQATFDLEVIAVDDQNPDGPAIPGVQVTLEDGQILQSGQTYPNFKGTLDVKSVKHGEWYHVEGKVIITADTSSGKLKVRLNLHMLRRVALEKYATAPTTSSLIA